MAFWNRKGPENLSLMQEAPAEGPKKEGEAKLSGAERVANFRQATWEKMKGAFQRTAEIGQKFVGGLDRVVGKGVEGYDAAKAGVARGAEAFQTGIARIEGIDVPQWLYDKGSDAAVAGEKAARAGLEAGVARAKAAGRGIKKGAEIGVGIGAMAAKGAYERGRRASDATGKLIDRAAGYAGTKLDQGIDWSNRQEMRAHQWVGQKYESLKGWAGEQASKIQEGTRMAKESFSGGVERIKTWKNQALDAYHQNRFEAHFAKLSPEAQAAAMSRLEAIRAGQELKGELSPA